MSEAVAEQLARNLVRHYAKTGRPMAEHLRDLRETATRQGVPELADAAERIAGVDPLPPGVRAWEEEWRPLSERAASFTAWCRANGRTDLLDDVRGDGGAGERAWEEGRRLERERLLALDAMAAEPGVGEEARAVIEAAKRSGASVAETTAELKAAAALRAAGIAPRARDPQRRR